MSSSAPDDADHDLTVLGEVLPDGIGPGGGPGRFRIGQVLGHDPEPRRLGREARTGDPQGGLERIHHAVQLRTAASSMP